MSIETQEIKQIDIDLIEVGSDTQSRVSLDDATVNEYAEAMQNGAIFPPIDVYHNGDRYWLADGFHRLYAAKHANSSTIAAIVHQGNLRDAILHSVGANSTHGLRRTNTDKRRAVEKLLHDEEWTQWSDNAIAKQCGVSQPFVSKFRAETTPTYNGYKSERKGLDGRVIDTGEIGKKSKAGRVCKSGDLGIPKSNLVDELPTKSLVDADSMPSALTVEAIMGVESALPEILTSDQSEQSSSIKQIPVSLVLELLEVAYPEELREEGEDNTPIFASCPVPRNWWTEDWDKTWEQYHRSAVEAFNQIAEQVNLCLWQIDNTFAIAQTHHTYSVGGRLAEYGLLVMDEDSTPPATAKQLARWMVSKERLYDSVQEIVRDALQDQRFDMLLALEVGQHPPVNRHEYWTQRYAGELAKIGVDYWRWRGNPESREICPELTQLLELPRPKPDAQEVLKRLADGEDPFCCFPLVNHAAERKEAYRKAFTTWHEKTLATIGRDALKSIYTVIYGCDWDLIENIINPLLGGTWWQVLGVSPIASAAEVKEAHRRLAKEWHPDVNPSPLARERMVTINRALEEFENTCSRVY